MTTAWSAPATRRPDPGEESRPPRVVCGVNGSASSRRALTEAVRRAVATTARLSVVRAYDDVGYFWGALASLPGGGLLPVPHREEVRDAEEATLRSFVDDVIGAPGVVTAAERRHLQVEVRAVAGDPIDVLVRESRGASVLVVGHGAETGPLTSVAVGCARRARCPVVVVEPDRPTSTRRQAPGRARQVREAR